MDKCYSGISIPDPITEICNNNYISTNCVTIPEQFIYLDLPAGSKQTEVNINLILALQTANNQIQDLLARVETLENT